MKQKMVCLWLPHFLKLAWSPTKMHAAVCIRWDTACMSLLPMSSMVSLLFLSFFFFFSHFLFSLFVLFLHVQFCKANSRYCISQLVSLQRKFTVSCSLLQYSVNGFMIYISIFINLPLSPSPDAFTPPLFFPKTIPIIVESLQTNIRWKDWKVCDIAI